MTLSDGDLCFLLELESDDIVGIAVYNSQTTPSFSNANYLTCFLYSFDSEQRANGIHHEQVYEASLEDVIENEALSSQLIFELVVSYIRSDKDIYEQLSSSQKNFIQLCFSFSKMLVKRDIRGKDLVFVQRNTFSGVSEQVYCPETVFYSTVNQQLEIEL